MSIELENRAKDPIYEEKDIPSLAASITLYVTAFSREPFNEKWETINGGLKPEDPNDLNRFISEVLHNPSGLIIQHNEDQQTMDFKGTTVRTLYPLNKIILSYVEALKNPEAVLLLKTNSGYIYKLSPPHSERMEDNEVPVAVARFVNYNEEQIPKLLDEMSSYLEPEELGKLKNEFVGAQRLLYLGEIVNLNDNLIQQGSFTKQTLEIYTEKYGDNLPDRVIYLTKPGTGVERVGRREKLNNRFMKALIEKSYPKETKFDHRRFIFTDSSGENTIIYISKINEGS